MRLPLYKSRFFILLFIIIDISVLSGQINSRFEHYTTEDGLSQNRVDCILRDKKGFMWFGTIKGLNRFDGYEFKIYTSKEDPYSISNDIVSTIFEYQEGILLLGTEDGFNLFDTRTEKFYRYYYKPVDSTSLPGDKIYTIYQDPDGKILIGTNKGLATVSIDLTNTKPSVSFNRNSDFLGVIPQITNYEVLSMLHDSKNNFWIGTFRDGLLKININNGTYKHFNFDTIPGITNIDVNRINSVIEDKKGNIWIGTGSGLNVFNPDNYNKKHYLNVPGNPFSIPGNHVQVVYLDSKDNIWLCSFGGLSLYNSLNDNFINFINNSNDPHSINNNFISSIYDDKMGNLWIGTESGGINKINNNIKKFHQISPKKDCDNCISGKLINSIFEDHKGGLWIGTSGDGLNHYDRNKGKFIHYKFDPSDPRGISGDVISDIYQDQNNTMWFGTWGWGLNRMDTARNGKLNFTRLLDLPFNFISQVNQDKYGRLWVATTEGVLILDNNTGKFIPVKDPYSENGNILFAADVTNDKDGNMYIPTKFQGVYMFKSLSDFQKQLSPDKKDVLNFTYERSDPTSPPKRILTTYVDKTGSIWFATRGSGLINMITQKDETGVKKAIFIKYTEDEGLSDNIVLCILEDDSSNLWLSTAKGLSKFNYKTRKFINYFIEDGLLSNNFFYYAAHKNKKGEMFFGTTEGLVFFHPDSIKQNQFIPNALITDFKIMNKSVLITDDRKHNILKQSITYTPEIRLSHKDYIFSFGFSSNSYSDPDKNKFAYMLEGFDKDWVYTTADKRFAGYTNIPGGEYIFKVKATNSDGVWNNVPTILKIKVMPPFWKKWWFYLIIILFIVFLVLAYVKAQTLSYINQQQILEKKVNDRTNELSEANAKLEEKQEEITIQNEELFRHRNNLEELVKQRTIELEKARKKAEESDKLKSAFLANMSHEIRTPMNAILGFSNLLVTENDSDEQKKFIEIINNNSETLMVLINDILDISKIESDQLKIYKSFFDACPVLDEFEKYYQIKARDNFSIRWVNKNECPLVLDNDIVRFKQVLSNLINNAVKYTECGSVEFGFTKKEKEVIFYVKDTGIGISEDKFSSIFNYFEKIEENRTKIYRGTGIGLSICKRLLKLMGGEIWLESKVNVGSIFYFSLPYSDIKVYTSHTKSKPTFNQNVNFDVVIAEDEETNYYLLEKLLKALNLKVRYWAKNGREIVEYMKNNSDNGRLVIMMDIKMPELDGVEALKEIRKFNQKVPIIAITAYATEIEKNEIMQNNFNAYITKPISKNDIYNAIVEIDLTE